MSALRRLITRPESYLVLVALVLVLVSVDASRSPKMQITARCYVSAVRVYQRFGRPLTKNIVRCRYNPTCSEYSIQAVQKYGFARGLVLTARRLASCRSTVKPGTLDPVAYAHDLLAGTMVLRG